jgi:hypothetical protein
MLQVETDPLRGVHFVDIVALDDLSEQLVRERADARYRVFLLNLGKVIDFSDEW